MGVYDHIGLNVEKKECQTIQLKYIKHDGRFTPRVHFQSLVLMLYPASN